jgi:hypothetical protein
VQEKNDVKHFSITNPSHAALKVFSLSGKLVTDLSPALKSLARVEDATKLTMTLPQGVYIARLSGGGRSVSEKIVRGE